jgi:diguanylate cyclase (GGDEF)-like protein/putative nucleotidyltransferase with HDIG domain
MYTRFIAICSASAYARDMAQFCPWPPFAQNRVFVSLQARLKPTITEQSASQVIAKIYIAVIAILAVLTALGGIASWQPGADLSNFLAFLMIAILVSGLKLNLPFINHSVSVNSLIILLGIIQLRLPQALALGCCSIVAHYLGQAQKRKGFVKFIFSLSSLTVAIGLSHRLFYWSGWTPYTHPIVRSGLVACCYFATNAITSRAVVSFNGRKSLKELWNEFDVWSCRYYLLGAVLTGVFSEATALLGWQTALAAIPAVYLLNHFYGSHLGRLGNEKVHAEKLAALHFRTIEALALAIEAKDHTTHDHLRRVQVYAMEIGKDLNLSPLELDALRAAALLHDIGKLAVPEHIISKPGKLTPEEFDKMKTHPTVGAEILERVEFPYPVVPIVAAHHEKWDGSGYPNGLKGDQIPVGARILSAVDCLDALASDRQYRRALPLDEAMEVLISEAGAAFDPKIVSILKSRYVELEQLARGQHADKLSTDRLVERGAAPAAGFESGWDDNTSLDRQPSSFLKAIAAARQEAEVIFEMAQDPTNSLSLNETLSVMAVRMEKLIPYDGLAVYLKVDGKLIPAFVTGDDFRLFSSLEIPIGEGLSGWVAENKKPILNGNPSVEAGYLNDSTKFSTLQSAIAVPLEGIDGVVGVLALYQARKDAFLRDHLRVLIAFSSKLALSIENNPNFPTAIDGVTTDYLTGLPNARSLFVHLESEVNGCLSEGTPLAVLACHLDGFGQVNRRFGRSKANRVLRLVADAMQSICSDHDCIAKMGGDEFVIVLSGIPEETIDSMVERLCAATSEIGLSICRSDVLSLSVGRALLPKDGTEPEVLLAAGERRMYKTRRNNLLARAATESTLSLSNALGANTLRFVEMDTGDARELASRPDIPLPFGCPPDLAARKLARIIRGNGD